MRLNFRADIGRAFGAMAAAALVASFIVGQWALNRPSVELAWIAVSYFALGEVLGLVAWLAWSKR